MPINILDTIYRQIFLPKYFTKGWGNPEHLLEIFKIRKVFSDRSLIRQLVAPDYPIQIIKEKKKNGYILIEGKFHSPFALYMPDVVPKEVQEAYFQVILPSKIPEKYMPICIHFAGTGDHRFWRRRNVMAKPLLKYDIGSILLENPFYGCRKPKDQKHCYLHNVSDIFVMGGCLILESLVLLHWCEKEGYWPLGLSGVSMGGHMASLAATCWPKPIVLVPCLSWTTASIVFTEGVMSEAIDWDMLQKQYLANSMFHDTLAGIVKIIDKGYVPDATMSYRTKVVKSKKPKADQLDLSYLYENLHFFTKPLQKRPRDAVYFMRAVMDECTHLANYPVPVDTSLVICIRACHDGYIPLTDGVPLQHLWKDASVRYINTGHVTAYFLYLKYFRKCIIEAFDKAKKQLDNIESTIRQSSNI